MASVDDESEKSSNTGDETCQTKQQDSSTVYQGQSIFDCGNQRMNFNRQFERPKDKINSFSTEKMVELGANIELKFEELLKDIEKFGSFHDDRMTDIIKGQTMLTQMHFKLHYEEKKSANYHPTPSASKCSESTVDSLSEYSSSSYSKDTRSTSTQTTAGKLYNRDFMSDEALDRQKLLNSNAQLLKELKSLNTNGSLKKSVNKNKMVRRYDRADTSEYL